MSGQLGGLNLIQADYNNDGCLDVLVLRGAWEKSPQRRSLLRNNCNGTFTDVTKEAGLAKPAANSQSAAWADINNDGLLDLFIVNERGMGPSRTSPDPRASTAASIPKVWPRPITMVTGMSIST